MTRQAGQRQAAGRRPVTRRLAPGTAAAVMVAALAIPYLPTAGAAAAVSRPGSGAGRPAAVVSRAGREASALAATSNGGTVRAWGDDDQGQLGDVTNVGGSSSVPVKVMLPLGTRVTSVRAGCLYTLALTSKGKVLGWGGNGDGQLGDGTTTERETPVRVHLPPGTRVTAIRAGCHHSLALTSKGTVLAWGDNSDGQLGDGSTSSSATPVRVLLPGRTRVRGLVAGCLHSLVRTKTGAIFAWGRNLDGELGDGSTSSSATPVRSLLPSGTKVTAVSAGCVHSLARTAGGHVLAWGFNGDGELGNGGTADSSIPVGVSLPTGLTAIAIGAGPDAGSSFAIVRKAKP